jgi:hypothetical protein
MPDAGRKAGRGMMTEFVVIFAIALRWLFLSGYWSSRLAGARASQDE